MHTMQIFKLSFGPKNFVIISDPDYARQILTTNSAKYSKGLLSEILVRPQSCHPGGGWVRDADVADAINRVWQKQIQGSWQMCLAHGHELVCDHLVCDQGS